LFADLFRLIPFRFSDRFPFTEPGTLDIVGTLLFTPEKAGSEASDVSPKGAKIMQSSASSMQQENCGVVYRVSCQNPGCGHIFDLPITPKQAGILAGTIACPRCSRHGGMLKPSGRLAKKLLAAKLVFKLIGVGPPLSDQEIDLVTEILN
jgi:hypothetical protein